MSLDYLSNCITQRSFNLSLKDIDKRDLYVPEFQLDLLHLLSSLPSLVQRRHRACSASEVLKGTGLVSCGHSFHDAEILQHKVLWQQKTKKTQGDATYFQDRQDSRAASIWTSSSFEANAHTRRSILDNVAVMSYFLRTKIPSYGKCPAKQKGLNNNAGNYYHWWRALPETVGTHCENLGTFNLTFYS